MSELSIELLGHPTVTVDGQPLDVDTRKAVALLGYLAVEDTQTRSGLAALLWPQSPGERARSALRRTLSSLRRGLGGRWIISEGDRLSLDRTGVYCDLWRFREDLEAVRGHEHGDAATCHRCLDRLRALSSLVDDTFLGGFGVTDSAAFDDWVTTLQQRIRRDLGWALDVLARGLVLAGDLEGAARSVEHQLELDPLHERAHRQLMLLEAWRGGRAAAVAQYRTCVAVLDRELGVAPVEQTRQLYQDIVDDKLPPRPASQPPDAAPRAFRPPVSTATGPSHARATGPRLPPLVGRQEELEQLLRAWRVDGGGRVLLIEGEPGIGKSRLVDELAGAVRAQGARVHAVVCHEGEARLTHAPIVDLLRSIAGGTDLGQLPVTARREAARLVPELSEVPTPPPLDSPGARARFFEGVGQVLAAACTGDPGGLLIIDDLHWADEPSRELIAFLIRRLEHLGIRLAACWRPEQLDRDDALRRVAADRDGGGAVIRLPLDRLDRTEVAELLAATEGEPDPDRLEQVHSDTEGLPLLLADELGDPSGPAPDSGTRRLRTRLDRLSDVARQVLTTAAVVGHRFDLDLVLHASGRSETETVDGLDELLDAAMIREAQAGSAPPSYDFTHGRIRRLAYEATSLARRRLLHGRVADALLAAAGPDELGPAAGVVAHHAQLAGRDRQAAVHHRRAGDHARSLFANREALEHYRAALALEPRTLTPLHEAVGDLLTLAGDYAGALQAYQAAVAHSTSEQEAAALEHKVAGVHLRRGDRAAAEAHLEQALAVFAREGETGMRARALADASLAALRARELTEADTRAREALQLAEAAGDAAALAQVHNLLGMLAHHGGDTARARRHLAESRELAERLDDPLARAAALNNLGLVARSEGEPGTAVRELTDALTYARHAGDRHREAAILNNLADAHHDAGEHAAARHRLAEAVALFDQIGGPGAHEAEIHRLAAW